ncbi:MAG TPA: tetratricopeptide repeat-containing glycosyltransferase family protein [Stellaceae bacterium]|nr:tetratricopeptide repeat-containing glycosyltransferase family protein [Stellaceae bacterium]
MTDLAAALQQAFAAYQRGKLDDAERLCLAIRADATDEFDLHHLLGAIYARRGRHREALACFDEALKIRPHSTTALSNRGNALQDLGRSEEALASYDRALGLQPDFTDALSNRGVTLREMGRIEEALASFERVVAIRPDYPEALLNRGIVLHELGRVEAALSSYDRALALRPDFVDCRFSRALLLLLLGRVSEAWREYEWRKRRRGRLPRNFSAPEWTGEDLRGKRIVLYAEQAFGDAIQFARFALPVAARGAEVILSVPQPLTALLRSVDGVGAVVEAGREPREIDFHQSLLSVPFVLGLGEAQIPSQVPYLRADPARIAVWSQRLPAEERRVGIVWQGNPGADFDRRRSILLAAFAPLAAVPGVRLLSLQKKDGLDQLASLPADIPVDTLGEDFDVGPDGFLDTAAVIMQLDLVISADTAVAHLAGALGRPVWVVLADVPDWRWMLGREDSPWYPTARLFRQRRRGDWDEVMTRVAAELASFARG